MKLRLRTRGIRTSCSAPVDEPLTAEHASRRPPAIRVDRRRLYARRAAQKIVGIVYGRESNVTYR